MGYGASVHPLSQGRCGLWLLLATLGCGGQGSGPPDAGAPPAYGAPLELVEAGAWRYAPLADDPLSDHQPGAVDCGIAGFLIERGELEMDTGSCNYLWLSQEALHAVAPGDRIALSLRHFDLTAPEPSQGHVALLFDGQLQWETRIDIPHAAQVLEVEFEAADALVRGGQVAVHLHNHGQNTWTLAHVRVRPLQ